MSAKKALAHFLISTCGLKYLSGGAIQRASRALLDEIDFERFREQYACPAMQNREQFFKFAHESIRPMGPIAYLEFGVHNGASIKQWMLLDSEKNSRFFGFDSFEGLPENWNQEKGQGFFDVGGNIPKVDDPRVTFIKGWFDQTVPKFAKEFGSQHPLVLHLDADLYSSTMVVLMTLEPFIKPGTMLIFDEFYDREHEYKALIDYQKITRKKIRGVCHLDNFSKVCVEIL
jgi:O-methyltransferase